MAKQKKCPVCQNWNNGELQVCSQCNSLLDKNEIIRTEREKKATQKVEKPSWLDSFLIKTKNSQNPLTIVFRYLVLGGWLLYMGIISFIVWFTVGFSG